MKVAIIGSRNYEAIGAIRGYVLSLPADTIVISGGASGVDRIAATAALARGLKVWEFKVDTIGLPEFGTEGSKREFGIRAFQRNQKIVDKADRVVAFWDGISRGTLDTITRARRAGKLALVFGHDGLLEEQREG